MLDFQLFRVQVYPSQQLNMFQPRIEPSEILANTILSLPTAELRKGMVWHIGNTELIEDGGLYFLVGRTNKSTVQIYKDGKFQDMEFEESPYTHVILDVNKEVCAIAKKPNLSPRTYGIASQLAHLLTESNVGKDYRAQFGIGAINDPTDFISFLRKAVSVEKLWLTFSLPNAWDPNEDFEKPLKEALKELKGDQGKVEFTGKNLKTENIEDLLRSVAAVGNDAGALLQLEEERFKVRKRITGNIVVISQETVYLNEEKVTLLNRIRSAYAKIRGENKK